MRNKIFSCLIAAITVMSCDDFVDINTNPNQSTSATPELVLTAALNATASQLFFNQMGAMWSGQWCPSGDVSGFVQEKTYDFNNTYGTGIWTNFYDILNDFKYVIDEGTKQGKVGVAAIGRVMSVFLYHKLVDTYNNVPYTEALKGTTFINPVYDNAQTVYEALVEELDAATADLIALHESTTPVEVPGNADIMYKAGITGGGSYADWIRFANTLKLRLLIRQTAMAGRASYITTEIGQISTTYGYLTADANINPGYLKTSGKQNPFWNNYRKTENDIVVSNYSFYRSTTFLLSQLPTTDIRRFYIVGPIGLVSESTATTGTISNRTGVTYGDETPAAYSAVTSGIGYGILKGFNMPMTIFTAAESYFLQSEAAFRGLTAGNAQNLYVEGIRASHRLLGLTNAQADASIANTPAAQWNNSLQQIITQKWISLVGYGGFEAWCDSRRTGFPAAPLSLKAIKSNPPLRLFYPSQELQTNAANVAAQGEIDVWSTGVFWDN
jgi:Starch-binding associating with outer membrane